jgi:hypothetical protein
MYGLFCLMRTIKHLIYCCKSHLNTIVMRYFYCERLVRVGSKQLLRVYLLLHGFMGD